MKEVRCEKCQRLLAKAKGGLIQIKCPRCKTINQRDLISLSERQRASNEQGVTNDQKSSERLVRR